MQNEPRKIKLNEKEIVLDCNEMVFNEHTLSSYMERESAWYDYFGAMLADAEHVMHCAELEHDILYSERYKEHKASGPDKLAEAMANADTDVIALKKAYLDAKHNVRLLQQHLKAWDRSHENAQSRGHFLRKEMDKLKNDIYAERDIPLEDKISELINYKPE